MAGSDATVKDWRELPDEDLFAALTRAGATLGRAELLVTYRDEPERSAAIDELLR